MIRQLYQSKETKQYNQSTIYLVFTSKVQTAFRTWCTVLSSLLPHPLSEVQRGRQRQKWGGISQDQNPFHSHIDIARSPQQTVQWSVIAHQNNSKHFFILVTKDIMFFHLRILLTSLNIYSNRTEKLGNRIGVIYYIALSKT